MKLQEIIKLMVEKPVYIRMGKGKLSKRFKCNPEDIVRARREAKNIIKLNRYNGAPRILFFDIETTPMISYTWGRWNQNVSLDQTIQESYMLCWSASWLSDNDVFGDCLTPEEAIKGCGERSCMAYAGDCRHPNNRHRGSPRSICRPPLQLRCYLWSGRVVGYHP